MKDEYDFSIAQRGKFFREGVRPAPPVHLDPEPIERPPVDIDEFWAKPDALGGRDFLPDGIPDDSPAEPDPRVFFDFDE
ncbi:hypothetical protein [Bradyrhizobium sp. AZCC 1693]|uniref:hypothetical protein n=1 Tax=Bradyrhizobium sp. AZCC 1693 TaxID=3117029 RepID=UPI002FEFC6A9